MIPNLLLTTSFRYQTFRDISSLLQLSPTELRQKISSYETHINNCAEAISQLRGCLNVIEAPINTRLPPELLSEIFNQYVLMCTEYSDRFLFEDILEPMKPIHWFCVTAVCRHWRSVALSTPELFTRIDLVRQSPSHVSRWCTYAKHAPLHVLGGLDSAYDFREQWEAIFTYAHRIGSLKIHMQLTARKPHGWPDSFSNLKSLYLMPRDHDFDSGSPTKMSAYLDMACDLLDRSPNLITLSIGLFNRTNTSWAPHISHQHLTKLVISEWKTSKREDHAAILALIISRLPSLDILELSQLSSTRHIPLQQSHSSLSRGGRPLSYLKLRGEASSVIRFFASRLVIPLKSDITATCSGNISNGDADAITDLLASSSIPWHAFRSMRLRTNLTVANSHKQIVYSWKFWDFFLPTHSHNSTHHKTSLLLDLCISLSMIRRQAARFNHESSARLAIGIARVVGNVEAASIHMLHAKERGLPYPSVTDSITQSYCQLDSIRDFSVLITRPQPLQAFLSRLEDSRTLPGLSSLCVTISPQLVVAPSTLMDIRDSVLNRCSDGGCRVDILTLKWTPETQISSVYQLWTDLDFVEAVMKLKEVVGVLRLESE